MTDKEFKRLNRSQLIEIIYQFQIKVDELTQENQTLRAALENKRLRIEQAGNIAEAALAVNNVMQAAQNAAQQYLDEIHAMHAEADAIIAQARAEAAAIIERAAQQKAELPTESDENKA